MSRVPAQLLPQLAGLGDQLQRAKARPHDRRRDAVREQVRPRALAQHVHDRRARGDVAAARAAHRLAERAGQDVDPLPHREQLGRAALRPGADEPDGVRVVDHDQRVVLVGEIADLVERRDVAVHREDAVGGDHPVARIARPRSAAPRARPCPGLRYRSRRALHSRIPSMIEAWLSSSEMTASSAPSSVSKTRGVGVEARGVEDRVLGPEELAPAACSSSRCTVCVPQMNRTDAIPKPHRSIASCAARMISGWLAEPEVVVRTQVEQLATVVRGARGRPERMRSRARSCRGRSSLIVPSSSRMRGFDSRVDHRAPLSGRGSRRRSRAPCR